MIIRINIDHEENVTVIDEEKVINVFMIKNVFSQRKTHIREAYVDVQNNIRVIVIIIWESKESDPVGMIWSTYYAVSVFIGGTQNNTNEWSRRFLNEKNIKSFLVSNILSIRVLFIWIFCKKCLRDFLKSCLNTTHSWANWFVFRVSDFLIFLEVPFFIEIIPLE